MRHVVRLTDEAFLPRAADVVVLPLRVLEDADFVGAVFLALAELVFLLVAEALPFAAVDLPVEVFLVVFAAATPALHARASMAAIAAQERIFFMDSNV